LERLVATALDDARARGADQAEVGISHHLGLSATARLGEVESLEYTNDRSLGITVYFEQRKGNASTSDLSLDAIRESVAKACTFAEHTAADKYAGLADAELMATDIPDLDLSHRWPISADEAIQIALHTESAALARDPRIKNSEGATVSTSHGTRAYGNSHGFIHSYPKSSHSISCAVLSEEAGEMQRDYWYSVSRDPDMLDSAESVGIKAGDRAVSRLGARKIKTTKAPVLYVPEVARGFIGHAIGAISGGAQYRKSSFLLGAAGEQIFPRFLQIQERPHIPGAMGSAAYDGEGVTTVDRDIVTNGELQGYVLSSYSARRLGLKTTGNAGGVHNAIIPGNVDSQQELLAMMGTGLMVCELIGQGVNGVTGDYSRGVVGFWVENGEIAYPVHEVTIAGNLRDLYQRIVAIGRDQDTRGSIRCGSLLVESMTIAGA
jgi:PmbA protein